MSAHLLVVAKAPVPGKVKTRLGADIGMDAAAEVAAAALIDTLSACTDVAGPDHCHLALHGDLDDGVHAERLRRHLTGWSIRPQRGLDFADRLAHAHAEVPGPVVQVGMDTPQVTPDLLTTVVEALIDRPAVLGPAEDGGWWVLGLRDPAAAAVLRGVPMSTTTTYDDTRAALEARGLQVGTATTLRDVDTVADADQVAREAPDSRFAGTWATIATGAPT